jgi:hypothetical protein
MYTLKDIAAGRVDNASRLYKTAQARIGCALFPAGRIVAVQFSHVADNGSTWYTINKTELGPLPYPVAYPSHHLTNFTL